MRGRLVGNGDYLTEGLGTMTQKRLLTQNLCFNYPIRNSAEQEHGTGPRKFRPEPAWKQVRSLYSRPGIALWGTEIGVEVGAVGHDYSAAPATFLDSNSVRRDEKRSAPALAAAEG